MEVVKEKSDISKLVENQIYGDIELKNAQIEWKGTGNVLYCVGKIQLENCKLRFTGNHSLIYFDENLYPFSIDIRVGNDSVFYLGKDCYLNKTSHMYATERKNILIGNQCLLSFECYFRTADPHLIYDTKTKQRLNFSKSILIGDHVWIGQNVLLLKNTVIGSGAIIGGNSVVSGKKLSSNTVYAGNPIKKIRSHVFYGKHMSTHDFDLEQEHNSEILDIDDYCYEQDKYTVDFVQIDKQLQQFHTVFEKIDYIQKKLTNYQYKNRFFID